MANTAKFYEHETGPITFQLTNVAGEVLQPGDFDLIIITVHFDDDDGARTFLRSSDDLLADEYFDIAADGTITWNVRPFETRFIGAADADLGEPQSHAATIEWVCNSPSTGNLTGPFTTTAGSRTVTVKHDAHGFEVDDDVAFNAPDAVGGLDLAGIYTVREVVDDDTYRIEALTVAAETETGGGAVVWFSGGDYRPDLATLEITRIDPVG